MASERDSTEKENMVVLPTKAYNAVDAAVRKEVGEG